MQQLIAIRRKVAIFKKINTKISIDGNKAFFASLQRQPVGDKIYLFLFQQFEKAKGQITYFQIASFSN